LIFCPFAGNELQKIHTVAFFTLQHTLKAL